MMPIYLLIVVSVFVIIFNFHKDNINNMNSFEPAHKCVAKIVKYKEAIKTLKSDNPSIEELDCILKDLNDASKECKDYLTDQEIKEIEYYIISVFPEAYHKKYIKDTKDIKSQ